MIDVLNAYDHPDAGDLAAHADLGAVALTRLERNMHAESTPAVRCP